MFRFIAELLFCSTEPHEIPKPVIHNLFPHELSDVGIRKTKEFDAVYAQYAPQIMKDLGLEIQELCWQRPFDPKAQFVNRYINVLIKRLAAVPLDERESELEALKLLIPANKDEYDYIRGDKNPIQLNRMGKQECWPLRNKEIRDQIFAIRNRINSQKANSY